MTEWDHAVGHRARMDNADRNLWQRSCATEAVEDECDRFLDMAMFADGRVDSDERERIAEWLRSHPEAAADIAAARALANGRVYEALSATSFARAAALVSRSGPSQRGIVAAFPARRSKSKSAGVAALAQWGGLAAAMIVAGWLGFTLGMDTSGMLPPNRPGVDDGFAQELFGSSPTFFRDLTGGA